MLTALFDTPDLPQARCRGRHQLFDASIEADRPGPGGAADLAEIREACMNICLGCPEMETRCRPWVDSLPRSKRPLGVCGGRLTSPKQPKQDERKKSA